MTAKILIAAQDLASGYLKGDIVSVLTDGGDFGNKESLPSFIRLTVSDVTKAQADAYLVQWKKQFTYTIDAENAQGYRCTMTVDPALIDASGLNAALKQEMKAYVLSGGEQELTVALVSQTANSLQVDIAKPADLPEFKLDINDKFEEITHFTQFYFSSADVDAAISGGGEFTRTKAQINTIIQDRIDD